VLGASGKSGASTVNGVRRTYGAREFFCRFPRPYGLG
jgi:hypothetical protein